MRAAAFVLSLFAIASGTACGGGGGAGGGSALCDVDFVGSCTAAAGNSCVEYGGTIDAVQSEQACTQGGSATWSSTLPCDRTGSFGACVFEAGGTCSAQLYFPPLTAADAEPACTQGGGVFVAL